MSWENMSGMEFKQLVRATKSMLISCIAVCFMDRHPMKMQLSVYETLKVILRRPPQVMPCLLVYYLIQPSEAVSRSIGYLYLKKPEFQRDPDFRGFMCPVPLKRAVITAEPSVIIRKLKPHDKFLIFASDGLWEQLTDEEAVEIVFNNPRSGIAKRLVRAELQEAANKREMRYNDLKKIETGTRRHFHDDITVVVIYLDQQNGSPSKRLAHTTSSVDLYSSDEGQLQGNQLHSATSSTITSTLMADPRRKDTFFEIPEDMRATWLLGKMQAKHFCDVVIDIIMWMILCLICIASFEIINCCIAAATKTAICILQFCWFYIIILLQHITVLLVLYLLAAYYNSALAKT